MKSEGGNKEGNRLQNRGKYLSKRDSWDLVSVDDY